MKKQTKVSVANRNSINGRFVSQQYADKHPRTTQTEHNPKKK